MRLNKTQLWDVVKQEIKTLRKHYGEKVLKVKNIDGSLAKKCVYGQLGANRSSAAFKVNKTNPRIICGKLFAKDSGKVTVFDHYCRGTKSKTNYTTKYTGNEMTALEVAIFYYPEWIPEVEKLLTKPFKR